MPLSMTQLLLNQNSEALLAMQQEDYRGALRILQDCLHLLQHFPENQNDLPPDPRNQAAENHQNDNVEVAIAAEIGANDGADQLEPGVVGERNEEEVTEDTPEEEEAIHQDPHHGISVYAIPIHVRALSSQGRVMTGNEVVTDSSADSDQSFQAFEEAIVTTCLDCADGDFPPHFLQAILIYNMALCLHQMGSAPRADRRFNPNQVNNGERHFLLRAAALYEMALVALHQQPQERQAQGPGRRHAEQNMMLLMLAICNNLCHISVSFLCTRNPLTAKECIDHMKLLLVHICGQNQDGARLPLSLGSDTPCVSLFSMNVVFFMTAESYCHGSAAA